MKNWLTILLRTVVVLVIGSCMTWSVVAEEYDSQVESQASVSFLPAPERPLYPELSENLAEDKDDLTEKETWKQEMPQNLPQTGEKTSIPSGVFLLTSVWLVSYIRRKLLDYKL